MKTDAVSYASVSSVYLADPLLIGFLVFLSHIDNQVSGH